MTYDKNYIRDYIKENCIYKPDEDYYFGKLPGTRYNSQFYLASALYNPKILYAIGKEFVRIVDNMPIGDEYQIAGREWSAIPLITYLPVHLREHRGLEINSFMVRKDPKTYGRHNMIEGTPNDLPVLLVDDLCNSTNSFVQCDRVLTQMGFEVIGGLFAVLNKYSSAVPGWEHDRYSGQYCNTILTRDDLI